MANNRGLIFNACRHGCAWRSEMRALKFENPVLVIFSCNLSAVV